MTKYIETIVGIYKIVEKMSCKDNDGHALYKGICVECGTERVARLNDLKATINCGHKRLGSKNTSKQIKWNNERLSNIFTGIKRRCYNEKCREYRWYGQKGIKICDEWLNNPKLFEDWAINSGYTDNLTINRLDEDKDYCHENCEWVTNEDNARYKSTTRVIEVNGEFHTGREWSEKLGFGINIINTYIRKYGLDNTKEFIARCVNNPELIKQAKPNQSYYNLYMSQKKC